MVKYKLGKKSLENLATCHTDIQRVIHRAMSYQEMDFSVLEGQRTDERQYALFADGKSQLDGVINKSRHQSSPSEAVDIVPYPINWESLPEFYKLATLIFKACLEEGVKLEWGGHWKSFPDMPHFQMEKTK